MTTEPFNPTDESEPCADALPWTAMWLIGWDDIWRVGVPQQEGRRPSWEQPNGVQGADCHHYVDHSYYGPRINGCPHRFLRIKDDCMTH